jgi:hypothetical protein
MKFVGLTIGLTLGLTALTAFAGCVPGSSPSLIGKCGTYSLVVTVDTPDWTQYQTNTGVLLITYPNLVTVQ